MAVHYNGIEVKRVFYNGTPLTSLFFNDVNVLGGDEPVTQVVSYDGNVDTKNRYGRDPAESPYQRNGWRNVITRPMTPAAASGSRFYYRFDVNLYWQNATPCTGIRFAIENAEGDSVTFDNYVPSWTSRGQKHLVFNAESDAWLGDSSSLTVTVYYTVQDSKGNYLYATYYGTSAPVTITMSNQPIE